jgi:hypothetical protein
LAWFVPIIAIRMKAVNGPQVIPYALPCWQLAQEAASAVPALSAQRHIDWSAY